MSNEFDPAQVSVNRKPWSSKNAADHSEFFIWKPGKGEPFLKGPIPWRWLSSASQGNGKAPQIAIAIWHQVGLKRCKQVQLNLSRQLHLGVSRDAGRRALAILESKGLISVVRKPGRIAMVTIILEEWSGVKEPLQSSQGGVE